MRAANKLFSVYGGEVSLDPAVAAHRTTTGATDLAGLDALIRYVRAEGLLSNFVIYPMKSAQNYGSGSTVSPIGGLTSNAMTLVNAPTWGADGISFNGSTQFGSVVDFLPSAASFTVFGRLNKTSNDTSNSAVFGKYLAAGDQRAFMVYQNSIAPNDPWTVARSADGTSPNTSFIDTSPGVTTGMGLDTTLVLSLQESASPALYANKTLLPLGAGSKTTTFDSNSDITVSAISGGVLASLQTVTAFCAITGSLTSNQREEITDLLNAL